MQGEADDVELVNPWLGVASKLRGQDQNDRRRYSSIDFCRPRRLSGQLARPFGAKKENQLPVELPQKCPDVRGEHADWQMKHRLPGMAGVCEPFDIVPTVSPIFTATMTVWHACDEPPCEVLFESVVSHS